MNRVISPEDRQHSGARHHSLSFFDPAPSFNLILKQRGLWGASLGLFSSNYNFYFILSWLPDYLVQGFEINAFYLSRRHLSAKVRVFIDMLVDRFGEQERSFGPDPG